MPPFLRVENLITFLKEIGCAFLTGSSSGEGKSNQWFGTELTQSIYLLHFQPLVD